MTKMLASVDAMIWAAVVVAMSTLRPAVGAEPVSPADLLSREVPPPQRIVSYGESSLQFGHLRMPEGDGPHPVVVFIHGGCWLSMYDIKHAAPLEQGLAEAGFAVWSIEYRRVGDDGGGWPNTFLDVGRGVDHVRELAGEYSLDLNRVIVSGHSAGGAFALWVAARHRLASTSALYEPDPLAPMAVVALAPAADLEAIQKRESCANVIGQLMGGSASEQTGRYGDASPMQLAPIGVPQILVMGALDRSWTPTGMSYFHRAVALGDEQIRTISLPESGHFEMIAPGTSSWPLVIGAFKQALRGEFDR